MVPNTSDDLPEPETPVNTVSRRLGISTLTSFRLFSRAPRTRIRSWRSAGCGLEEAVADARASVSDAENAKPPEHAPWGLVRFASLGGDFGSGGGSRTPDPAVN